eukprot:345258-Pleurochrysis_carterae.AAC.1
MESPRNPPRTMWGLVCAQTPMRDRTRASAAPRAAAAQYAQRCSGQRGTTAARSPRVRTVDVIHSVTEVGSG